MIKWERFTLMLLCCWFATAAANAAQTITEPFLGVRHIFQTETSPRPLKIHAVEIDLSAPGLSFRVTPRSASYPGPYINGSPGETNHQTTRAFANAYGAQVAINGALYASSGSWANNLGLTAAIGDEYSPWEGGAYNDNYFDDTLHISPGNLAQIVKRPQSIPSGWETDPPIARDDLYNAVTGSHRIVQNGAAVSIVDNGLCTCDPLGLHARTGVGLTADNSKLLLMTVDKQGGSQGVTLPELAAFMLGHGATNAINLDGGGSTTMVMNFYGDGLPAQLINSTGERAVGTNLGVFALPNGDFNLDGGIDAADYVVWRKTIGGEFAYDAWNEQFAEASGGTGGGAQVPEPGIAILPCLIVAMLSVRNRTLNFSRLAHPAEARTSRRHPFIGKRLFSVPVSC